MLKKTGLLKVAVVSLVLVFVVCGCKTGNGDEGLVDVSQFADLGNKGVKIAIGEPESVPAGNYAMKILDKLGEKDEELRDKIVSNIVTKEPNVRAVLDKVVTKEVDAGFVYLTDAVQAKDKVKIIDVPADISVTPAYPIAVLKESDNMELAKAFVDYVTSVEGIKVLEKHGFAPDTENPRDFSAEPFNDETLVVYAAISMTDAFEEMAENLKQTIGADIKFKFASSGDLAQLIESGAVGGESGADVFASANVKHMESLKEKGFVEDYIEFTENKIVVVVAE
jgi:molybdate transport system substrate-binding protein